MSGAAPAKEKSFLTRVRNALPTLHPAERRLGEFVCDFPGELASYSGSELAELAQVSKATVSRFVKRLGYDSYESARRDARAERQTGSRLFLDTATADGAGRSVQAQVAQSVLNLEATFAGIPEAQIDAVAQAVLAARKVWVIGFRSSHAFASYLQWQMTQVVEQIVAIPGAGQTLGEHLVSVQPRDLVIVFGLRRRVAVMEALLREVQRTRAPLLYITDEGVQAHAGATWHFRCHSQAPGPLFNHVAVAAVCHLLATRVIERSGRGGRARLREIETLNDSLEEL
jgi:DNA-binding MurR/RpiR family transcriptional regulator